jgi:hypothetical protein
VDTALTPANSASKTKTAHKRTKPSIAVVSKALAVSIHVSMSLAPQIPNLSFARTRRPAHWTNAQKRTAVAKMVHLAAKIAIAQAKALV